MNELEATDMQITRIGLLNRCELTIPFCLFLQNDVSFFLDFHIAINENILQYTVRSDNESAVLRNGQLLNFSPHFLHNMKYLP
jgi:hypothetical protein